MKRGHKHKLATNSDNLDHEKKPYTTIKDIYDKVGKPESDKFKELYEKKQKVDLGKVGPWISDVHPAINQGDNSKPDLSHPGSTNMEFGPHVFMEGDNSENQPELHGNGIGDIGPPDEEIAEPFEAVEKTIPDDELEEWEEVDDDEGIEEEEEEIAEEEEEEEAAVEDFIDPEQEPTEELITSKSALQEVNEERAREKRLRKVKFLIEYSKNTHRTYDVVANKIGVAADTGRHYLTEFIRDVKESILQSDYPNAVFVKYNAGIENKEDRLKFYHLDRLKDIVRKYGDNYSVDEAIAAQNLNSTGTDTFISNHNLSSSPDFSKLSLLDQPSGVQPNPIPQPQPQQPQRFFDNGYSDIDHLYRGITALQLIRFGIITITNSTQAADKISQLMGDNVDRYIQSEQDMRGLLSMARFGNGNDIERFIQWLKMNAHYVAMPTGFLAMAANGGNAPGQAATPLGFQEQGSITTGDPVYNNYVAMGVFIPGLPASHPTNLERLRDWEERKREDDQMKSMERKFNMFMRAKMLEMFDTSGKKDSGGFGDLFNNPMLMMMLGLAEQRVTTNPDGTQTTTLVPKFGGMGAQQPQNVQQNTEMMSMFKEMVGFMTALKGGSGDNQLMAAIMPVLVERLTAKPENQFDSLLRTIEVANKIKGDTPPAGGPGYTPIPPDVLIQQKRMELDQQFAMRRFDLEERKMDMEAQRLSNQDREAHENVASLMGGLKDVGPVLLGVLQQFLPGAKGPGMPGGPMGPMGPMSGGMPGQPGGMNPTELMIRMEYEKQRRQEMEEKERKEREWQEEMRLKNHNPYYQQPTPQPAPQPAPPAQETTRMDIDPGYPTPQPAYEQEPEVFDESYFRGRPISELMKAKAQAERERIRLETYLASAEAVIQETMLNNEMTSASSPPPNPMIPSVQTAPPATQIPERPNFDEALDIPPDAYDPDYSGPEDVQVEKEQEPVEADGGEEGEDVEI